MLVEHIMILTTRSLFSTLIWDFGHGLENIGFQGTFCLFMVFMTHGFSGV